MPDTDIAISDSWLTDQWKKIWSILHFVTFKQKLQNWGTHCGHKSISKYVYILQNNQKSILKVRIKKHETFRYLLFIGAWASPAYPMFPGFSPKRACPLASDEQNQMGQHYPFLRLELYCSMPLCPPTKMRHTSREETAEVLAAFGSSCTNQGIVSFILLWS